MNKVPKLEAMDKVSEESKDKELKDYRKFFEYIEMAEKTSPSKTKTRQNFIDHVDAYMKALFGDGTDFEGFYIKAVLDTALYEMISYCYNWYEFSLIEVFFTNVNKYKDKIDYFLTDKIFDKAIELQCEEFVRDLYDKRIEDLKYNVIVEVINENDNIEEFINEKINDGIADRCLCLCEKLCEWLPEENILPDSIDNVEYFKHLYRLSKLSYLYNDDNSRVKHEKLYNILTKVVYRDENEIANQCENLKLNSDRREEYKRRKENNGGNSGDDDKYPLLIINSINEKIKNMENDKNKNGKDLEGSEIALLYTHLERINMEGVASGFMEKMFPFLLKRFAEIQLNRIKKTEDPDKKWEYSTALLYTLANRRINKNSEVSSIPKVLFDEIEAVLNEKMSVLNEKMSVVDYCKEHREFLLDSFTSFLLSHRYLIQGNEYHLGGILEAAYRYAKKIYIDGYPKNKLSYCNCGRIFWLYAINKGTSLDEEIGNCITRAKEDLRNLESGSDLYIRLEKDLNSLEKDFSKEYRAIKARIDNLKTKVYDKETDLVKEFNDIHGKIDEFKGSTKVQAELQDEIWFLHEIYKANGNESNLTLNFKVDDKTKKLIEHINLSKKNKSDLITLAIFCKENEIDYETYVISNKKTLLDVYCDVLDNSSTNNNLYYFIKAFMELNEFIIMRDYNVRGNIMNKIANRVIKDRNDDLVEYLLIKWCKSWKCYYGCGAYLKLWLEAKKTNILTDINSDISKAVDEYLYNAEDNNYSFNKYLMDVVDGTLSDNDIKNEIKDMAEANLIAMESKSNEYAKSLLNYILILMKIGEPAYEVENEFHWLEKYLKDNDLDMNDIKSYCILSDRITKVIAKESANIIDKKKKILRRVNEKLDEHSTDAVIEFFRATSEDEVGGVKLLTHDGDGRSEKENVVMMGRKLLEFLEKDKMPYRLTETIYNYVFKDKWIINREVYASLTKAKVPSKIRRILRNVLALDKESISDMLEEGCKNIDLDFNKLLPSSLEKNIYNFTVGDFKNLEGKTVKYRTFLPSIQSAINRMFSESVDRTKKNENGEEDKIEINVVQESDCKSFLIVVTNPMAAFSSEYSSCSDILNRVFAGIKGGNGGNYDIVTDLWGLCDFAIECKVSDEKPPIVRNILGNIVNSNNESNEGVFPEEIRNQLPNNISNAWFRYIIRVRGYEIKEMKEFEF